MKQCNTCEQFKNLEMYSKDKYISDGHKNKCKSCEKTERDLKQGRSGKKNVNNVQDAKEWLLQNFPKFEIVEFGPPIKLLDKDRSVEFQYPDFSKFKSKVIKNPNRHFGASKDERMEIIKKSMIEKYGGPSPFSSEDVQKKARNSLKERYGVENVFELQKYQDKAKESMIDKYGDANAMKVPEIKEKFEQTMIERYGVQYPYQSEEIRNKMKNSLMENHGVENPSHVKNFKTLNIEAKVKSGIITLIDGRLIKDLAKDKGVSHSHLNDIKNKLGIDAAREFSSDEGRSQIELFVKKFLEENCIEFSIDKKFEDTNYRPDFQIPDHKIVIECNGLYWHSDKIINDKFCHRKKMVAYKEKGYDSLFFLENEILNKSNIVKSIILNKLKLNKEKVFARKCKIETLSTEESNSFFEENHLMGRGAGRTYALKLNGEIISAIRVKWISKENGLLDVSRFCTKNNISVVGGYSRLISHVEKTEQPKTIQTFVDKRYGDGSYLEVFGFHRETEYISFYWTDFRDTCHRLTHPYDSGYEKGLHKIWDCGQAKWVKNL